MYELWLSETGTEAAEEKRLTWKERRLGKEVPKKLQGRYFIESQKAEIQRWKDTHAVKCIPREEAENLISCRFVNRWQEKPIDKENEALGTQMTATSRLCARGFQDSHWWIRKSSPTVRRHTQRCLQHESVQRNWKVCTRDARRAFLQVEKLLRRVCVEPPPEANEDPGVVWLLLKPVYGIGDAPREWTDSCIDACKKAGGVQVLGDKCAFLFFRKTENPDGSQGEELWGWVCFHMDDFKISSSDADFDKFEQFLLDRFEMGARKEENFEFCGIETTTVRDENGVIVEYRETQKEYIEHMEMIDIPAHRAAKPEESATEKELADFRGLLGGIHWVVNTRADAAHEGSYLSSQVNCLQVKYLMQTSQLLQRLQETSEIGLVYRKL